MQINQMKFSELTFEILENLIKTVPNNKKFIPDYTICAMPSHLYDYHDNLMNFILKKESNTQLCIGFSSGGARKHTIYCDEKGTFYVIFQTVDRGTRIYYLTRWILKDLLMNINENNENNEDNEDNNEDNNEKNNDYSEVINNFVNPEEIKNLHVTKSFG
jgi:hypothetical protein